MHSLKSLTDEQWNILAGNDEQEVLNLFRSGKLAGVDFGPLLQECPEYFVGRDLSGAKFAGASFVIRETNSKGEVNIYGAKLDNANFERADLSGTDLRLCYLKNVCMNQTNLEGANCEGATFGSTRMINCHAPNAIFIQATFTSTDLTDANLRGAQCAGARFKRAILTGTKLRGVEIDKNYCEDTDLDKADFKSPPPPKPISKNESRAPTKSGVEIKTPHSPPHSAAHAKTGRG